MTSGSAPMRFVSTTIVRRSCLHRLQFDDQFAIHDAAGGAAVVVGLRHRDAYPCIPLAGRSPLLALSGSDRREAKPDQDESGSTATETRSGARHGKVGTSGVPALRATPQPTRPTASRKGNVQFARML